MKDHANEPEPFPLYATIAGVAVVTIPITDYAALLECQRREAHDSPAPAVPAVPSRSPVERDMEVTTFLAESFGRGRLVEALEACRIQFGSNRTPSRTAAYAYWKRLRSRR
ncbi:hypothetical protein [Xanthobacter aminoxidans]|uniref:hypothetical protein n=1 Tax=Xanthobacter aminoxidans TaxID=186280 RepID=UPI002022FB7E|nr:hypothetical protein [Xanthobacter aminoxidans]MCL8381766.1 hypothetical protein [Xanthobacter aminoxidans]